MTRRLERGIPWPGKRGLTREGWQRGPSLENLLAINGLEVNSNIPPRDKSLLKRFYRLRQLVQIGVVAPATIAERFERALEKKGRGEEFYDQYRTYIEVITRVTEVPKRG